MRRAAAAIAIAAAATLIAAAPASAHIQVSPTVVAPNDPVLFQLLVPNERSDDTVEIKLQIPKGVLAFSFEDTPGWRRTTANAADGSVGVVTWKGSVPEAGFVRFSFLASTPEKPGELAWKAVQTYADGTAVRWIGAPGSEFPAAVTKVEADAPRQNAGGEGGDEQDAAAAPGASATPAASAAPSAPAPAVVDDGGDRDPLAIVLGAAGLLLGALALAVALRTRGRLPSRSG